MMHLLALFLFIQHGMLLLLGQGTPWDYTQLAETPFSQCCSLGSWDWFFDFSSHVLDFTLAGFHTIPVEAASEVLLDTSTAVQCMGCSSCLNISAHLMKVWYNLL